MIRYHISAASAQSDRADKAAIEDDTGDDALCMAISAIRDAHPTLTWAGWWTPRYPHPCGFAQCRADMTAPWGIGQFRRALAFIEATPRTIVVNRKINTYAWKHRAERLHEVKVGFGDYYVGEGMFIAAAFASGLLVKPSSFDTFVNLSGREPRA